LAINPSKSRLSDSNLRTTSQNGVIVKELGPVHKVMIDGGKVINVHASKVDPCTIRDSKYGGVTGYKCMGMKAPSPGAAVSKPVVTKPAGHALDKKAWTNPICAEGMLQRDGQLMFVRYHADENMLGLVRRDGDSWHHVHRWG
jgi:hypothetical protein